MQGAWGNRRSYCDAQEQENMRTKGKIISWNDEKGFGFIKPTNGSAQVFIHIKAFYNRNRRPEINQFVTYALSTDKRGRPCAADATLAGDRHPSKIKTKKNKGLFSIAIAVIFIIIVCISVVTSKIPPLILALYLIVSMLTFIMYAADKSAAKKGEWRIKENTLHLLSLVGGWPGALIAQKILRHKSKKESFRAGFWLTVFVNCAALAWLFTAKGEAMLNALVANI